MNAIRLSLVAAIVALGLLAPQAVAITGGQVDEENTYSNVGAVVVIHSPFPEDQVPYVGATGTLIHPRVLLTAGHVTALMESVWAQGIGSPNDIRVSFGVNALDPKTWLEIEDAIAHPDYLANPAGTIANDVGVMILKKPVNTRKISLAKLPYPGFLDDLKAAGMLRESGEGGTPLIQVGYGSTLDWPPPTIFPADGLRRFVYSDYLALATGWLYTLQNLATGNGGVGYGDSGGPTFWVGDDGTLVVLAVTGHGDPNRVAMSVDWRVDIPETLDFIDDIIAMVDAGLL